LGPTSVDAALLDLGDHPPAWLPTPVSVWPARRLPAHVSVLGYPHAEKALHGVWRDFVTSGPAAGGTVQLDWSAAVGTLPGQSGGPVVDAQTASLVGVLVEGSQAGRFDRFLPLSRLHRDWPQLPRPWVVAGPEGRGHFTRRAYGQRSLSRGGDLFRGRRAALVTIRNWLTCPEPPGRPLVVTARPGAGKSAVLARAALTAEADRIGPGLAFHARAATLTQYLDAVADLTGVEATATADDLLDAVAEAESDQPWLVVLDALDEAATRQDSWLIAVTLSDLAVLPGLRVAVATRPLAAGDRYLPDGLVPALGVTAPSSPNLVDLDTDQYFDREGLEQFAAALLAQHGADHPGPPGAAWTRYRTDSGIRKRLARAVAARAGRNYLVAAMAAVPLSTNETAIDPADASFDPASIPSGVGEALDRYLTSLPDRKRAHTRGLLTALGYARGNGIDDRTWLRFSAALGYPATVVDLDLLRGSAAADYLLQTVPADGGPVTRLFHKALTDQLLAARHQPTDEHALLETLLPADPAGWTDSSYLRLHAAEHAAAAGELPRLLDDPHYLAAAEFSRLLPLLTPPDQPEAGPIVHVLRRAAARASVLPPLRRARLLALTAAHLGYPQLHRKLAAACTDRCLPRWANRLGDPHQELTGHTDGVRAVAIGRVGGQEMIISAGADSTVRRWEAATGQPVGDPLTGHAGTVNAVAIGRVGGQEMIVSAGADSTVRRWEAATGQPVGDPLSGHAHAVYTVAIGRVGGREVIVSAGYDRSVRLWQAATGRPIVGPLRGHADSVNEVAIGRVGGREVIVSAGYDGTVRVWEASTGAAVGMFTGHDGGVLGVAIGRVGGREVIVSAGDDGTVRLWQAKTGAPLGLLTGHVGAVYAVAVGWLGEREVIVSAGYDRTVRVWDAGTGQPAGDPLTGHAGAVNGVTIGRVGAREVIVSASYDRTLRVWEPSAAQPGGDPPAGHRGTVLGVATGWLGGREVVASAGADGTVRVWDAATGQPAGDPLTGHTGAVNGLAIDRFDDQEVIVSAGADRTVRVWDLGSRRRPRLLTGHTGAVLAVALGRVGDREMIVSAGADRAVRVWDAGTGQPADDPLTDHTGAVWAVTFGRVGARNVIVSGGDDGTVRVWDAGTGQPSGAPLIGHAGAVNGLALGRFGARGIIASAGEDGTVRVWDAATGHPVVAMTGHSGAVNGVAIGRVGVREMIVSAGDDGTIRVWDAAGASAFVLDLLCPPRGVVLSAEGMICAATGTAVCAFDCTG